MITTTGSVYLSVKIKADTKDCLLMERSKVSGSLNLMMETNFKVIGRTIYGMVMESKFILKKRKPMKEIFPTIKGKELGSMFLILVIYLRDNGKMMLKMAKE